MGPQIGRRLAAELVGTLLLVLFGAGAAAVAFELGGGHIASDGFVGIALAHGLVLAAGIYAFGPASGGHFNPSVTVALALTRRVPWVEVLPYVGAQLAGGVIGAVLVVGTVGLGAVDSGVGATAFAEGVGPWQAALVEVCGTAALLVAIMAFAVDPRAPRALSGLGIGLALIGIIQTFGPLTGASLNLGRTLGPLVATSLFGGAAAWDQLGVYLLAPLLGGLAGVAIYDGIVRPPRVAGTQRAETQGTRRQVTGTTLADPDAVDQGQPG